MFGSGCRKLVANASTNDADGVIILLYRKKCMLSILCCISRRSKTAKIKCVKVAPSSGRVPGLSRYQRCRLLSDSRHTRLPGLAHVLRPHSHYGGSGGRSCGAQPLGRRSGKKFSRPWSVQWPTKVALQRCR